MLSDRLTTEQKIELLNVARRHGLSTEHDHDVQTFHSNILGRVTEVGGRFAAAAREIADRKVGCLSEFLDAYAGDSPFERLLTANKLLAAAGIPLE